MAAFAPVLFTCSLLCTFAVYKLAALQCVAIATSLLNPCMYTDWHCLADFEWMFG